MSLDIDSILESIGEDIIAEMQSNLEKNKPGRNWSSMASGDLYGSFQTEIKNNILEITSSVDYSGDVDLGMPPKEVSTSSIMQWMSSKRIQGRNSFTGKFMSRENVAFLISRKLKSRGYSGINYVLNTFETLKDHIEESVTKGYAKQIEKTLEQNISKKM
jgi:hypothetical protein